MTSKLFTLLLGATVLCAWGCLAEIVKALLRQEAIPGAIWTTLAVSAAASAGLWVFCRSRQLRPEIRSFLGSSGLGVLLIGVFTAGFVLPGFIARGGDLFDLVFTAVIIAATAGIALYLLRRRYFTPPDTPEGLHED
ncbi:MAG: hypothetical protein ACTH2U_15535 [Brevibacterium sp.]